MPAHEQPERATSNPTWLVALLPIPLAALVLSLTAFASGLIHAVLLAGSVIVLIALILALGISIGVRQRRVDQDRLDAIDPLGDLPDKGPKR